MVRTDLPTRRIPHDDFERALFRERLSRFFISPNISADLSEFDDDGTLSVTILPAAHLVPGGAMQWLSGPASVGRAWLGEREGARGAWVVAVCCEFPDSVSDGEIVDTLPIFLWLANLIEAARS